jgi:alpha-tubulin suppressor-like RCC1 family protein
MENREDEMAPEVTRLCAWGNNMFGQLAFENKNNELKVFVPKMISFGIHIIEISCGFEHSLLRSLEGELFSVGNNKKGQLGLGKKIKRRMSPTLIPWEDSKEKVLLAAAQGYHNVVYTEYGNIYCWGDNTYGQLGTGDYEGRDLPHDMTDEFELKNEESIVTISLGRDHSTVLLNTGRCFAWGSNNFYQLGIEAFNNAEVNLPKICMLKNIKNIAAGYEQTLFVNEEGELWVCGNNEEGRLIAGNNKELIKTPTNIPLPEKVNRVFSTNFNALLTERNDLYVWGCFMEQILPMCMPFEDEDIESMKIIASERKIGGKNKEGTNSIASAKMSNKLGNMNKSSIRLKIETVGLGENFLVAADEAGDCYTWGFNGNGELGQTIDEENEDVVVSAFPKRLEILRPFEVKAIYTGASFVFSIIKEREELEGDEGSYVPYNLQYNEEPENESRNKNSGKIIDYEEEEEDETRYRKVTQEHKKSISSKPKLKPAQIEIDPEEQEQESLNQEESGNSGEQMQFKDKKDVEMFEIFRILIFLYENLRYNLIKVIDDNIDVDSTLSPYFIELIKKQQDIIDDYLKRFNLKIGIPIEITPQTLHKFKYPQSMKLTKDFLTESQNEYIEENEDLTQLKVETKRFKSETLIKLSEQKMQVAKRIAELKAILKV